MNDSTTNEGLVFVHIATNTSITYLDKSIHIKPFSKLDVQIQGARWSYNDTADYRSCTKIFKEVHMVRARVWKELRKKAAKYVQEWQLLTLAPCNILPFQYYY